MDFCVITVYFLHVCCLKAVFCKLLDSVAPKHILFERNHFHLFDIFFHFSKLLHSLDEAAVENPSELSQAIVDRGTNQA